MPFRSKAQQRFMHAVHPDIARRWDALTDFKHLPERSGGPKMAKNHKSARHAALARMSTSGKTPAKARLAKMIAARAQRGH